MPQRKRKVARLKKGRGTDTDSHNWTLSICCTYNISQVEKIHLKGSEVHWQNAEWRRWKTNQWFRNCTFTSTIPWWWITKWVRNVWINKWNCRTESGISESWVYFSSSSFRISYVARPYESYLDSEAVWTGSKNWKVLFRWQNDRNYRWKNETIENDKHNAMFLTRCQPGQTRNSTEQYENGKKNSQMKYKILNTAAMEKTRQGTWPTCRIKLVRMLERIETISASISNKLMECYPEMWRRDSP